MQYSLAMSGAQRGDKKNVLVIGPPRSGTSLAASIFARAGYHVGVIDEDRFRLGDDYNPFGYYEADALIGENVQILRAAGFPSHNTWLFEEPPDEMAERIHALTPNESQARFLESYAQYAPWVWKDPRLCFTLPVWSKLLDASSTALVLVRRDATEVYRSFLRMGWTRRGESARADALRRIEKHMRAAERAVAESGIPALALDFADYRRDPAGVADRLNDFLGLELRVEDLNFQPKLDHSTAWGRLSIQLRLLQKSVPRPIIHGLERILPTALLNLLFPERRWSKTPRAGEDGA